VEINHRLAEGHAALIFKRVRVPQRVTTPRIVQSEYQAGQVMKGYRALEDAGKLKNSGYTPEQVKRAWSMPDNEG
jgi:hypothetical protein